MAIDKKFIFSKTMFHLKKESKFYTSSDVGLIIGVEAFKRIAEEIDFPKSNYSTFVASGVWTVTMPNDFVKVDQNKDLVFRDYSTTYRLKPKYQKDIGRHVIIKPESSAVPQYYFMEDQTTLGIFPPSTSGLVVVPYVKTPISLSSDADTNELTDNCYMAAIYWTCSECMLKDNDPKFDKYYAMYEKEVLRLKKRYGEMHEINYDVSPDEEYL